MNIPFPRPLIAKNRRAVYLNKLNGGAKSTVVLPSLNVLLMETPYGTFQRTSPRGKGISRGSRIQRCKIVTVNPGYLLCDALDDAGQPTSESFYVARPVELRGEPQTRDVVVVAPNGIITERIYPPYAIDDEIYAGKSDGKTDFTFEQVLEWIDLNVAGRHWAPTYRKVCATVDGIPGEMIVPGGPQF